MSEQSLTFARRGLSSVNKLIVLSFLSVMLLMLDSRYSAVQTAKKYVATALYPLQWLANLPVEWYEYGSAFLQSQTYLLAENQRLTEENAQLKMQSHHADVQKHALSELKGLFALKENGLAITTAAEIISNGKEPFSSRIIINKGSSQGVHEGDAVVDQNGLIGQVSQVHPVSAEVTILVDTASVIPIMVARTGVRSLAHGGSGGIALRYFPTDADLQPNDLLITSGLDSVFAPGIPVARVTQTSRNAGTPYYRAELKPVADLYGSKYVLVLPQNTLPEHTAASSASASAKP